MFNYIPNAYRKILFPPLHIRFLLLFGILLLVLIGIVNLGMIGSTLGKIGLSPINILMVMFLSFIFSPVNIPLYSIRTKRYIITTDYISFFGILYPIPKFEEIEDRTLVMVNVGGALIPLSFSIYLLMKNPIFITHAIIAILIVSLITKIAAKPIKGVGIATPAIIPPLAAASIANILSPNFPYIVAYVSGTIGTLIGADILNLHKVPKLGASVVSIGGAGAFDGIFLSGLLALILS
mgnify:CR=1 FL=1